MMVHQACFMCMQVAAALPSSSAYWFLVVHRYALLMNTENAFVLRNSLLTMLLLFFFQYFEK